jgi:hypothetical protein
MGHLQWGQLRFAVQKRQHTVGHYRTWDRGIHPEPTMPALSPKVTAAYETALPDDIRVKQKTMFGSPCAFVNRQMFFGTFEESLVARVGPERVRALVEQVGMQVFTLSPGKQWDDYVQMDLSVDPAIFAELASEALSWAAALPKKVKRPKK